MTKKKRTFITSQKKDRSLSSSQLNDTAKNVLEDAKTWVEKNKGFKVKSKSSYNTSPRISSEINDCAMPLTFDSYNYCFPAGTKVTMSNLEEINIENISIGDKILSFNENTKEIVDSNVINTAHRKVDEMVIIKLEDGTSLEITPNHPIYVKDKGWIQARYLTGKDYILKL